MNVVGSKIRFCLEFIAGPYRGSRFPIAGKRRITIGRGIDLDLVLDDALVSRNHAQLQVDEAITLRDLDSTNGTFVNGQATAQATLAPGDTVLIGGSIFRLSVAGENDVSNEDEARIQMESIATQNHLTAAISGTVEQVPLPDLIQLMCTIKSCGVLHIVNQAQQAQLHFRQGVLKSCLLDEFSGLKALVRLLQWSAGHFELTKADAMHTSPSSQFEERSEHLLMEGLRQVDELKQIRQRIPDGSFFELSYPLQARLSALSPPQLEVLQLVYNCNEIGSITDGCALPDLLVYQILAQLREQAYIHHSD